MIFFLQRCVVVQEVFPDGLIAQDGRLRPGDQIIEINGVDMTCANHLQVNITLFSTQGRRKRGARRAMPPRFFPIQYSGGWPNAQAHRVP